MKGRPFFFLAVNAPSNGAKKAGGLGGCLYLQKVLSRIYNNQVREKKMDFKLPNVFFQPEKKPIIKEVIAFQLYNPS